MPQANSNVPYRGDKMIKKQYNAVYKVLIEIFEKLVSDRINRKSEICFSFCGPKIEFSKDRHNDLCFVE